MHIVAALFVGFPSAHDLKHIVQRQLSPTSLRTSSKAVPRFLPVILGQALLQSGREIDITPASRDTTEVTSRGLRDP